MNNEQVLMNYIQSDIMKGKAGAVGVEDDLLASGVLDSLGILQLVAFIDDRLGIQVPDEDVVYENFHSVRSLSEYLEKLKPNVA